jgi:hypothetical protein
MFVRMLCPLKKTLKKRERDMIIFIVFLGCLCRARPSISWKIPARSASEVMKGTSSLKIDPSPKHTIVKNKSYKGHIQELKIGEVSNSLRQLALKLQSYELPARLRCSPLGLCVSKLKLILSQKSCTTSAVNK